MNFIQMFRASPVFMAMKARTEFDPFFSAPLPHWRHRDIATGWCEQRWRDHQRPYRRRIDAEAQTVTFEFSSDADALAFRLAAKRGFRSPQPRDAQ